MGKPVIAPRTKGIRDYFDENALHFFDPGNATSLAEAIIQVYRDPARRQSVLAEGMKIFRAHDWQRQQRHFVELVRGLLAS
jgi:glycosyltransferase involved in cell wall biosynthesis